MAGGRTHDEHERAFLQGRLALFGKWAFVVSMLTDLMTLVLEGLGDVGSRRWFLDRSVGIVVLAVWLICRRGAYSFRVLRFIDAASAAVLSLVVAIFGRFLVPYVGAEMYAAMGGSGPPSAAELMLIDARISMMLMLSGSLMFCFRAAIIPSPPRVTLFVTGVLGSPFVWGWIVWAPAHDGRLLLRDEIGPMDELMHFSIWWVITVATTVAISVVIYGLRREVRQAQQLGQYTLVEKIGEGGMGVVYRARHARLRRPTAVKLLPPGKLSEEAIRRFESEVQLTATLSHPNTVTVFDYGRTDDGIFYYAMEYLVGVTLEDVVAAGGELPPARVARIMEQLADALSEAHAVGLIHRDIKPSNIMLSRRGVDPDSVTLLDFGLARVVERGSDAERTRDDRIVGTPLYMAPEVIRDAEATSPRSDLYALGAVGYFLLTGEPVFTGSVVEICADHIHRQPEPPSQRLGRDLPAELEALILSCLAKAPEERPESAAAVVLALRQQRVEPAWSLADAEAWWEAEQSALEARRARPEPLPETKLTVV